MAYKILGSTSEASIVIVIKESDWSIETTQSGIIGSFEIEALVSGTKTVVARNMLGSIAAYGKVQAFEYGGARGVIMGGHPTFNPNNTMYYITFGSPGNAASFGDSSVIHYLGAGMSNGSNDRAVIAIGYNNAAVTTFGLTMDYITMSTTGSTTSFGNVTFNFGAGAAGTDNHTNDRGIIAGGGRGASRYGTIHYITIPTTGDSTDFGGTLTQSRMYSAGVSNGVNERGVIGGGYLSTSTVNTIDYVTINTGGNATNFGDLSQVSRYIGGTSNLTNERAVFMGGQNQNNTPYNTIEYITINSLGNSTDFGDLQTNTSSPASSSDGLGDRAVVAQGYDGSVGIDKVYYFTISTPGDAQLFGDISGDTGTDMESNA